MRVATSLLLAAVMLFAIAACGDGADGAGEVTPTAHQPDVADDAAPPESPPADAASDDETMISSATPDGVTPDIEDVRAPHEPRQVLFFHTEW